jgi:hypothetical protein
MILDSNLILIGQNPKMLNLTKMPKAALKSFEGSFSQIMVFNSRARFSYKSRQIRSRSKQIENKISKKNQINHFKKGI